MTPAHQILESPLINRQKSTMASWPPYKLLTLRSHRQYIYYIYHRQHICTLMYLREQYNNIFKALFDLPCSPSYPKPHTVASYFVFLTHWPHSRHSYSHTRPTALEITAHCDHTESHTHHGWSDEARIRVPSRPRIGPSQQT